MRTEQWRKTIPRWRSSFHKNKPEPPQNTTKAETQKLEEHEQRKQRIERMQVQEASWTERRFFSEHQNNNTTTNKKQPRIPYSLKTYSNNTKQKYVLWTKEIHQRKRNNDFLKGYSRKDPQRQQNEILVLSLLSSPKFLRNVRIRFRN